MVTEYFFNFSYLFVWKNRKKKIQLGKIFFHVEQFFFQPGKIFFPTFPGATLQKNNEISKKNNLLGLRKHRKQSNQLRSDFSPHFLRNQNPRHFLEFYVDKVFELLSSLQANQSSIEISNQFFFLQDFASPQTLLTSQFMQQPGR